MATNPKRRRILKLGAAMAGLAAGSPLRAQEMQEKYAGGGSKATAMSPKQFAAFIKEDTERWAPVIRASGAKVE